MSLEKHMVLVLFVITINSAIQFTKYEPLARLTSGSKTNGFHQNMNESSGKQMKHELDSQPWAIKEFEGRDDIVRMHAFIVRDENILPCCSMVKHVRNTRHFMCSGAVLTLKHAITSASCLHFADVYEHHINAELAVLIDAFSPVSHSIKINGFEMHPNYDYDVDSNDLPTFDLAILFLNCSLSFTNSIIPRLPRGFYDDIGHMCCGKQCELMTIIQDGNNQHAARILPVKYLPSPIHDSHHQMTIITHNASADSIPNYTGKRISEINNNLSSSMGMSRRVKKSPKKLAGAPTFFFDKLNDDDTRDESRKTSDMSKRLKQKKSMDIFNKVANARSDVLIKNEKIGVFPMENHMNGNGHNLQSVVNNNPSRLNEETLTSIDWKTIEEKLGSKISAVNREKIEKFTKKLVDVTMKRVDSVVDKDVNTGMNDRTRNNQDKFLVRPVSNLLKTFLPHASTNHENRSLNDFAIAFANILKSVAVPPDSGNKLIVSSDLIIDESDLNISPPKYVECPPLGTPVFRNGILIAMIAYTCDDVQNWVEWKYVSISKNIKWIRKRISVIAGGTGSQQQSTFSCDESQPIHAALKQSIYPLTKVNADGKRN